jgi:hypothetical protein
MGLGHVHEEREVTATIMRVSVHSDSPSMDEFQSESLLVTPITMHQGGF